MQFSGIDDPANMDLNRINCFIVLQSCRFVVAKLATELRGGGSIGL